MHQLLGGDERGHLYVYMQWMQAGGKVSNEVWEVEDIRQMMEIMKRMVTGLGLEDKGGQTGIEWHEEKGEGVLTPDRSDDTSEEDRDTDIEIDGEHGTKAETSRRRMKVEICSGAPILATNSYKRNPDSPLGNEGRKEGRKE